MRALPGAYKLLWDFLYHDCDHAGIWIVDFEIAQMYIGKDMVIDKETSLHFFNDDEIRIVEIDGGKKWFIPSFILFQYGTLSEKNRAHLPVISVLKKYNLINSDFSIKPLTSPLQGAKEMELEEEMEMEQEEESEDFKNFVEPPLVPQMQKIWINHFPKYFLEKEKDFPALQKISSNIAQLVGVSENPLSQTSDEKHQIKLRWGDMVDFISREDFFKNYSLSQVDRHFQSILQKEKNGISKTYSSIKTGKSAGTYALADDLAKELGF